MLPRQDTHRLILQIPSQLVDGLGHLQLLPRPLQRLQQVEEALPEPLLLPSGVRHVPGGRMSRPPQLLQFLQPRSHLLFQSLVGKSHISQGTEPSWGSLNHQPAPFRDTTGTSDLPAPKKEQCTPTQRKG